MPLTYRPIGTKDLLFVERLVREMMPGFRVGAQEVKRLLGREPGELGRLFAIEEGNKRVGMVGAYAEGQPPDAHAWHLVGPFLLAQRRERLYVPTVVRRALHEARALGCADLLAHRLEGEGVPLLSSVWPTVGSQAFYAWRGSDLLAETGFVLQGESLRMTLPEDAELAPSRVPPPFRLRPYAPMRDADAAGRVLRKALRREPASLATISAESALVAVADGEIVGVVDWDGEARTLRHLAVIAERQGRGLGRALLTHAVARLREQGRGAVRVEVDRDNARAIALFRSAGSVHESTYACFSCAL